MNDTASTLDTGTSPAPETRLSQWERRTEWPMVGLSVLFLVLYAWDVLDTERGPGLSALLSTVMWLIWLAFAADYAIRLVLAENRVRFVLRNLFDLAVIALPLLRQLRVLRLVMVLMLLNRRLQSRARGQVMLYLSGATLLLGISAALTVLGVERYAPDSKITTLSDALWWTLTTMTTVGYGDYYPVTGEGKLIAAGLMIAGVAMLGVVTGSVASWFVEKFGGIQEALEESGEAAEETRELQSEVTALREEIALLRTEIGQLVGAPPAPAPQHEPR